MAEGLGARDPAHPPLIVMACENAINATDLLKAHVVENLADASLAERAIFANTAVDRIVPGQSTDSLDVTVEAFFEWAIETGPFKGELPIIPEAHFVDDLAPYIERKLFTVNTGHAAASYLGYVAGARTPAEALAIPEVAADVRAVLEETAMLLIARHRFDPDTQREYLEKNLTRFANPHLDDTVARVGRQPLRKLGRNERFIAPAAALAEEGIPPEALLRTIAAALRFRDDDDPQSAELEQLLQALGPDEFVAQVTGLEPSHPLFARVSELVEAEQARLAGN